MIQIINFLPGLRTYKTALSLLICMLIWNIIFDEIPFYACIAAVITMQNSLLTTIENGANRILGTLIGAAAGAAVLFLLPVNLWIITLCSIIVIHLTSLLKKPGATSIACVVFFSIVINIGQSDAVDYIIMRILETSLGIVVAMSINYLIKPPPKEDTQIKPAFSHKKASGKKIKGKKIR